jgi:carboxyl-terminal processing protease
MRKVRQAEIEDDKAKRDQRTAARAKVKRPDVKVYSITLENVNKPELQLVTNEKPDKKSAKATDKAEDKDKDQKPDATAESDDATADDGEGETKPNGIDPIKNETLNILGDFIELTHNPKSATASASK